MITKIISGGQTGADRGGLDAGIELGLELGGWCPAGYRSDDADRRIPERYARYLTTTRSRDYSPRTWLNIEHSDGTVILSMGDQLTGGSLQTALMAKKQRKPCLHIVLPSPRMWVLELDLEATVWRPWLCGLLGVNTPGEAFLKWVTRSKIQVLNVAGPRVRKAPGIQEASRAFLVGALREQLSE